MKKARTIITYLAVMTGVVLSVFGLTGCSVGSLAPELELSGVKFEIDETKFDKLLQKGYTVVKRGKPYPNDTKIADHSITNSLDLCKDGKEIGYIALKNDSSFSEESLGGCVAHYISLDYKAKEHFSQEIYLEGVPLFTTKPEVLIPKLEKKFGKEAINIIYYTRDSETVRSRERDGKKLDIDVTKRVSMISFGKIGFDKMQWIIHIDLETQTPNSLEIRADVNTTIKNTGRQKSAGYKVQKL